MKTTVLRWSKVMKKIPMNKYHTNYGLDKKTTYFFIGGDFFYEKFHGSIYDLRFYSENAIEGSDIMCTMQN